PKGRGFMPHENDDDTQRQDNDTFRDRINRLERKAKEAEDRANKAERQLAFAQAGIQLDDPKMKYFVNGYDGEIEAGKIREAAVEAGFLTDSKPETKPESKPGSPPAETQEQTPEQLAEQQAFSSIDQA